MDFQKYPQRLFRHFISAPVIYSFIIPAVIFDIWLEVYHRICFPLYRLPFVKRSTYIRIDRHKLKYLTWTEKLNCMYCGYVNGLIHYASVIAGNTEKYWCGIKHRKSGDFKEPLHHRDFMEYDDYEAYIKNKERLVD